MTATRRRLGVPSNASARFRRVVVAGIALAAVATVFVLVNVRAPAILSDTGQWTVSSVLVVLILVGTLLALAVVMSQATKSARRIEVEGTAALEERDRFFDVSKDLLVTASADGFFVRVNPAWTTVLGYELETLTSRPYAEFIHPDDLEATAREVERQVRDGQPVFRFENRYRHRDGTFRWLEWTSAPSEDGSRLYAAARDITERKLAEERLRAPAVAQQRRIVAARERILGVLDAAAFGPVYQPITDIETGAIVGFEALTRFADGGSPAELFATAAESGLRAPLELATLKAAMTEARALPRGPWLSVNLSPSTLADLDAVRRALGLRVRPLILEITENETIAAYGPVRDAVRGLGPDVRLAVDDAGAGVANFNHLVELRPDFVKIDAGLVRGVDADLSRQALVAGMLHFAATARCEVIAEGIETESERQALYRLGVHLGQGFLLGRPAPAIEWTSAGQGDRVSRPGSALQRRRAAG